MATRPEAIAERVVDELVGLGAQHALRVAVDGPPWSGLDLVRPIVDAVGERGLTPVVVRATDFLRPASVRLERGRDDPVAFYESWIDIDALRREVVEPSGAGGSGQVLPSLWDVVRDRATRADYVAVDARSVIVIDGWFLLGHWLDFDLTVHVALSPAARRRRVPADVAGRELPAWERYDVEVSPDDIADIVVRGDDPRRPALVLR